MSKNTWPCPGKPEDLKGQPIGMYHCEFCGEMQLAGVTHLPPQFPSQWEEPFPKVEEPPDYGPHDGPEEAVKIHPAESAPEPGRVRIMLAGDMPGQTHVGYHRDDAKIFHTIARAPGGALFTIGDHFDTCPICKEHDVTLKDFHAFMRQHTS